MNNLIDTTCINMADMPFEIYKIEYLSNGREEMVFLHQRELVIGTRVKIRARYFNKPDLIIREVTGTKRLREDKWEIFVMCKGV